ncbi:hypothetical protein AB4156_42455, partial [Cupriavidus sp. 2MCAB6]
MTPLAPASVHLATPGGYLLVLAVTLPVLGVLAMLILAPRHARQVALVTVAAGLVTAIAIVAELIRTGSALTYVVGGWQPPLGIALRADGLSATMIAMTAVVLTATCLFARDLYA